MSAFTDKILSNFHDRADEVLFEVFVDGFNHTLLWSDLEIGCKKVVGTLNDLCGPHQIEGEHVVLIFLPHGSALFPVFLGSMLGGYVPSFMPCPSPRQDSALYWQSHQKLLERIRPVAIVTTQDMVYQINEAGLNLYGAKLVLDQDVENYILDTTNVKSTEFVSQSDNAIALLQHSSGTTGLKKGVALSYNAIQQHAVAYGNSLELTKEDVIVSWLPLYHDMGLIACFITPSYHATKTIQISAFDWLNRPNILFDKISEYNATLCWLPNFSFEHLTNTLARRASKFDLSSMRAFISCSEPCKSGTFERFTNAFAVSHVRADMLKCCYAMAEVVFGVTQVPMSKPSVTLTLDSRYMNVGDKVSISTRSEDTVNLIDCGVVLDNVTVTIVNSNREAVDNGIIGEIAISSNYLFSGYSKDPERTAKQLANGIYYSNDLGFLWHQRLYVLGRQDDLIIVNGRNLFAHEIEAIAGQVTGVKAGRVVAIPHTDEKVGSDVLVLMAERDPKEVVTDEYLLNSVIKRIQSEIDVVPRAVLILDPGTLVKTSSGKMSRKENQRRYVDSLHSEPLKKAS